MNKQEIYELLAARNMWYEVTEHIAVYNMEDLAAVFIPYPEADAKNLFVRDDKKQNYYLITVKGNKRVDLREFRRKNGTRNLSFASPADLEERLSLIPGAVTPLGLLNGGAEQVHFFLDRDFFTGDGLIGVHPNDNTATVFMKTEDLVALLSENGYTVNIFEV